MSPIAESTVEEAALEILDALGYTILHGPEIAPVHADSVSHSKLIRKLISAEMRAKTAKKMVEPSR
jgi:hypothetical protein